MRILLVEDDQKIASFVCHLQGNYKENERVGQDSQLRPQFSYRRGGEIAETGNFSLASLPVPAIY